MTPEPGWNCDLDAATEDAVRRGDSAPHIEHKGWAFAQDVSLLVAVCVQHRLDLAERLFDAGAKLTAEQFAHVIWWSDADIVRFLLDRGTPHNEQCFRAAAQHEKWDSVFALLDHGADVETLMGYGAGLLHVAAWQGESFLVQRLLERGADVHRRDSDQRTPLLKACDFVEGHKADAACVYWLLKHGADVNARSPSGETALVLCTGQRFDPSHYIARQRTQVAQMLVRYGADSNAAAPNGGTPLMFAARDNDIILAQTLLRAGARADARNKKGETARDVARRWKSKDVAALL